MQNPCTLFSIDSIPDQVERPRWTALVLPLRVRFSDGSESTWNALVDTGASLCVVRPSVAPESLRVTSPHPVSFVSANGSEISGGTEGLDVSFTFRTVKRDGSAGKDLSKSAFVLVADIAWDCILGYSFLRSALQC